MKRIEIEDGENWARCPICNVIWNTSCVWYGCLFSWDVKDCDLPPMKLTEKLCPDHVEEIVVNGRRKGIRRTLYKDQLNEIKKNDLYCPVCKSTDLRMESVNEIKTGLAEVVWICSHCQTLIVLETRSIGKNGDKVELVQCSYREDLQIKEFNKVWSEIVRSIENQELRSISLHR